MESKLIEHVEKELNPEYMNDVFTWKKIKDALAVSLQPISEEIPTDEEIENEATIRGHHVSDREEEIFINSAKWMRDKWLSRGVAKEKCTACENHFINQELCPLCEVYRMKVK